MCRFLSCWRFACKDSWYISYDCVKSAGYLDVELGQHTIFCSFRTCKARLRDARFWFTLFSVPFRLLNGRICLPNAKYGIPFTVPAAVGAGSLQFTGDWLFLPTFYTLSHKIARYPFTIDYRETLSGNVAGTIPGYYIDAGTFGKHYRETLPVPYLFIT
jgi:hypothetical protein